LDNQDAKLDPDLQPLTVLKPADLICHLWQRYSSTALLPLASAPTLRKEMSTFGQHNIVRMEGKINRVIQKALDSESTSYHGIIHSAVCGTIGLQFYQTSSTGSSNC
jgi:hypothetical protein